MSKSNYSRAGVMNNCNVKIVFIDSGYMMFNTLNNVRQNFFRNEELPENLMESKKFVREFKRQFKGNLYRISKHFKIHFNNIVFVRDCARSKIWRNSIYVEYKKNRPKTLEIEETKKTSLNKQCKTVLDETTKTTTTVKKQINISDLFIHIYNEFIPNLKEKIKVLKFNELEADDVIAILSKKLEHNKIHCAIISEDKDFQQLHSDYIHIYNLMLNENQYRNVSLLNKLMDGDRSDNINALFYRNMNSVSDFLLKVDENDLFKNLRLMNFEYIPTKYKIYVIEEFKKIMNNFIIS